jgi:nucleotide-binding universal stress UspA family protein
MIQKILAALDGSKTSESIMAVVDPFLATFDAAVTLAMVIPEDSPLRERQGHAYLEALAGRFRAIGRRVDVAVLAGTPAPAIAKLAADHAYDLLALCTRGRSGLRRFLLGSVAEEILRRSSVPVLVAHPSSKGGPAVAELRKIVIPLDGSHRSASILPSVTEIARAHRAKVMFVTVVSPTRKEDLPVDTICHNVFREQERLKSQGLDVDLAVVYGDPATEILAFAAKNQADMIAISTHGRTGLDRMRHGSVTEEILRRCRMTMLVFRTAAVVREHPLHARGAEARRRALGVLAATAGPGNGPYSR